MSAIAAILLEAAGSLAVPFIKKILKDKLGGNEMAGDLIDVIAGKVGIPAEKLPQAKPEILREAIVEAEPMAAEMLAQYVESQRLSVELQKAEIDKGPTWTWGWRPAGMWMMIFLVLYTLVLRPLVNAAFSAEIEAVDLSFLMTVFSVFAGLYMGGHTAKDLMTKWRSK